MLIDTIRRYFRQRNQKYTPQAQDRSEKNSHKSLPQAHFLDPDYLHDMVMCHGMFCTHHRHHTIDTESKGSKKNI